MRPFVQVLLPSIVETSALNSLLLLARSPQRTFGSRQSVLPLSEVQHRLKVLGRLPLSVRLQLPNNSPILFALQGGEAFHYSHPPPLSHPIPGGRSSSSIRTAPLCFPVSRPKRWSAKQIMAPLSIFSRRKEESGGGDLLPVADGLGRSIIEFSSRPL